MASKDNEMVAAALFASPIKANIALGMLRANGIPCVLYGELARDVLGIQLAPCDSIRLMVNASDLDTAQQLLSESADE